MGTNKHQKKWFVRANVSAAKHHEFLVRLAENGDTQQGVLSLAVESYVDGRDIAGNIAALPKEK